MQVVGLDPHPNEHVAAVLDPTGKALASHSFANTPQGLEAFLHWIAPFSPFRLAVEGPSQPFFASWLATIVAEDIPIIPISTQEVSLLRRSRARGKRDTLDASLIAQVLLSSPDLPQLNLPSWLRPLQELSRTRKALVEDLKAYKMRLQSRQHPSVKAALTHVVETLNEEVKCLEKEIKRMVQQIAPELLAVCGVGPVLAGTLLAEGSDIGRFPREDSFASYCGAAPIPWESGIGKRVRVNPGGNRRLNAALHLIALTRLRVEVRTRRFWERKIAEGKTKREVLRILKTYLAREIYHVLKSIFIPISPANPVPVSLAY